MNMEQKIEMRDQAKPEYEAPVVRVMSEAEVLSAFQVTAAGTGTWWAM